MTLWKFDERWLKYAALDDERASRWFADEFGVHAEGLDSLNPLVPVVPCEHDRYDQHDARRPHNENLLYRCPGAAVGEEYGEACQAAVDAHWLDAAVKGDNDE